MAKVSDQYVRLTTERTVLSLGQLTLGPRESLAKILTRTAPLCKDGNPSIGAPNIYKLPLSPVSSKSGERYRAFEFGEKGPTYIPHRVIMIVGETGSGKSTLINGMINYLLGVEWEDNFRFKIIDEQMTSKSQAESQTEVITAYTIHVSQGLKINYTLTLIDTPGFGDTRGIQRDKAIMGQMREFFTSSSHHQVDHIDAIGFVAMSPQARLTPTQKYIFDSILSIFGKDIEQNIMVLVTFSDGHKPLVKDAIKAANIPHTGKLCKFNNCALFANTKVVDNRDSDSEGSDDENESRSFWDMGQRSMNVFFHQLERMQGKSLTLTRQVLDERSRLEVVLSALQLQISVGCSKIERLKEEENMLRRHKEEVQANKNFKYKVTETICQKKEVTNNFLTNCQTCRFTCHYPCIYPNDADKYKCYAMTSEGTCRVCPGKCHWNVHFNQKYRFEYISKQIEKTYREVEKRYNEASGKKLSVEDVISKLKQEFGIVQDCVSYLVSLCRESIERLEDIALRPTVLSMAEYVSILVESEKKSKKPGWQERVNVLRRVGSNVEIIKKIQKKQYNPFEIYQMNFTSSGHDQWYT